MDIKRLALEPRDGKWHWVLQDGPILTVPDYIMRILAKKTIKYSKRVKKLRRLKGKQ